VVAVSLKKKHSDTAGTRGEGADVGEGLAAAGKKEAAAHATTVAAGAGRSPA